MYQLTIKSQAKKKLLALPAGIRVRIAEQIHRLGKDPDDARLDIKMMRGQSRSRLRVGDWRIIFERNDKIRIITVEKIGARGDVYK